jgi:Acyl-CoA dehydrogenase, C-terminal domain
MAAAVHAVDVACRLVGSSSVRDNSHLDRLQRDTNTMRQHTIFSEV